MIDLRSYLSLCFVASFSLLLDSLEAQVIVSDDFSQELGQSSPLEYYCSQGGQFLSYDDGSLIIEGNGNRYILAYFREPGMAIELNQNEAIALEVSFQVSLGINTNSRHLRFALFDSQAALGQARAVTAHGFGLHQSEHSDYRGYQAGINAYGTQDRNMIVLKRDRSDTNLLFKIVNEGSGYTTLGSDGSYVIRDEKVYTLQLYVRKISEDSVEVNSILAEGSPDTATESAYFVRVLDSSEPVLKFDTLAFGIVGIQGDIESFEVDSLKVFIVPTP